MKNRKHGQPMNMNYDDDDDLIDEVPDGMEAPAPKELRERTFVEYPESFNRDSEQVAASASMWAKTGPAYFPVEETVNSLSPGQYVVEFSHSRGIYFRQKAVSLDKLLILPDSTSERIVEEIEFFWKKKDIFQKLGFLWKRGILLYGPPGGGKTSTLQIISKKIIDRGGLSIYVKEPRITAEGLEVLRRIEPNRPIVVMIEDFDAIQEKHGESDLLAMLDGDLQIDNVVFIATTNYPEELPPRIVNRPSRFDLVRQIGMPSDEARRMYLEKTNPRIAGTDEVDRWVDLSKGFSIAHLKEMIVSVECLGQNVEESVDRLRQMQEDMPSSDDDTEKSVGFTSPTRSAKTLTSSPSSR